VGGAVAVAGGAHSAVAGSRSLPGAGGPGSIVESELSYYAAFYAAFGAAMISVAPRAERQPRPVAALAAALFGGGLARTWAWRRSGAPHPIQRALLALELGVPPAIAALQLAARRSGT
jgi:hypothetical protein